MILDRTVAALAEINPPVAAAVKAAGANRAGHPLPGLLGWLPRRGRVDLARALDLAYQGVVLAPGVRWDYPTEKLVHDIYVNGTWRKPYSVQVGTRVIDAVYAYGSLVGLRLSGAVSLLTWVQKDWPCAG